MEIGQTGIIVWRDGKTSKVSIVAKETYSYLPTDFWLEYSSDEIYRPLVHPDLGESDEIKASILLPESLMEAVFKLDEKWTTEQEK